MISISGSASCSVRLRLLQSHYTKTNRKKQGEKENAVAALDSSMFVGEIKVQLAEKRKKN